MLEKIQKRLNEETEKVLNKKELSIADYQYLTSLEFSLKQEKSQNYFTNNLKDMFDKLVGSYNVK